MDKGKGVLSSNSPGLFSLHFFFPTFFTFFLIRRMFLNRSLEEVHLSKVGSLIHVYKKTDAWLCCRCQNRENGGTAQHRGGVCTSHPAVVGSTLTTVKIEPKCFFSENLPFSNLFGVNFFLQRTKKVKKSLKIFFRIRALLFKSFVQWL